MTRIQYHLKLLIPSCLATLLLACEETEVQPPQISEVQSPQVSFVESSQAQLICDDFQLVASLQDSTLALSLETDLPDDTIISITVNRSYWQSGRSDEYSRAYFSEEGTVGEWRHSHKIDLDAAAWKRNLEEFQSKMERATLGFSVTRISNDIEMTIVVPTNGQTNPAFGERNKNLEGKAVTSKGYGNFVEGAKQITYPL